MPKPAPELEHAQEPRRRLIRRVTTVESVFDCPADVVPSEALQVEARQLEGADPTTDPRCACVATKTTVSEEGADDLDELE